VSVPVPLRFDPEQRFTCSQCGSCCYRWDVFVTDAEISSYQRRNAAAWFRETADAAEGTDRDPFEPMPGWPGLHRIRKRDDGGCGFLSPANRCRIHEELGADRKPLTCRMFPYTLFPAPDAVVVTASFGCPTIIANVGRPIATGPEADTIKALSQEWFSNSPAAAGRLKSRAITPRQLVSGRAIDSRSTRVLRESLLAILKAESDLPTAVRRIAAALDDLTRSRVLSLPDEAFAEYISLTLPYAAANNTAPSSRSPSRIGGLLQYGFLYAVAATRLAVEQRGQTTWAMRASRLRLLAHFHRLAPPTGRVDVRALARGRVDINAPGIRPLVFHYLRSTLEAIGGRDRPIVDDVAIAVSYLNAALSLAVMNAAAAGRSVDRDTLSEALMESVLLSHTDSRGLVETLLRRLGGGTEALWRLAQ
jgi:Fe-S-cluster containining protein